VIHKYGPHLFHTNNKTVIDYLSQFTSWEIYNHQVLAFVDGQKIPIPFNLNTIHKLFPTVLANKFEEKLLSVFDYNTKIPILELTQSTDTDLQFLANFIYEKIFVNYTQKQWGVNINTLDRAVSARVPILIGRDNRYFNDTYQFMPKGGYTKLVENILYHKNIKMMLNTDFHEICNLKEDGFYFMDQKFNGKVIYTGQIDDLFSFRFGELPYRSIDMQFETLNQELYQPTSVVNYPNNYNFTRITEFKHIHPINTPVTTILKEYPQQYVKNHNEPYYPIFIDKSKQQYQEYLQYSEKYSNLILLGRLAEYKYYDIDDVIERALNVFNDEVKHG
jgi:UDP-galactopyranose mutase